MSVDEVTISSRDLSATIRALGAELVRLKDGNGHDYLWTGDPAWWAGQSPILFPIVGEVKDGKLKVDGKVFSMARHGFARRSAFELISQEASHCTFRLLPNDETRAQYPFEFELRLDYRISGRTLQIQSTISNHGAKSMPASFGFHPGFRWPLRPNLPKTAYSITFDRPESEPVERPLDGLLSGDPRPSPVVDKRLALDEPVFKDGAIIFEKPASRRVVYGASTGPRIAVSFEGMPHLGIWSLPGAGFVCIEPWQGYASPRDFDGELKDKPGILSIAPGATRQLGIGIEIEPE